MHPNYFYSHYFIHPITYINFYSLQKDLILGLICSQTLNLAAASQNSKIQDEQFAYQKITGEKKVISQISFLY